MPFFSDSPTSESTFGAASAAGLQSSMSSQMDTANFNHPVDQGTPFGNALGMAGLAPVDLLDTLATNKFVAPITGLSKGDLDSKAAQLTAALGMPGVQQFYDQHKEGIEALSGVGGVVAADILTKKFVLPGVTAALSKIPYASTLGKLDAQYQNALNTVRAGDDAIAARGATGLEQYSGAFSIDGLKFNPKLGAFESATINTTRGTAVFKAKAAGAASGAFKSALTEGVSYAALNSNGFLYQDDAASNLLWQAVGLAGGAVGEYLHGAYQIRKYVNSDGVRRAFANASDPDAIEAGRLLWHGKSVAPAPAAEMSLGGAFTDQITSLLSSKASLENSPVSGVDANLLLTNRQRLATQHEQLAMETAQKVTTKGISGLEGTRFTTDTAGFGTHIRETLHNDPTALFGAELVGAIPEGHSTIGLHQDFMESVSDKINKIEDMLADPVGLNPNELDALGANRRRLEFMNHLTPMAIVDRELMPMSEATVFDGWQEPKIKFNANSKFGDKASGGIYNVTNQAGEQTGVSLGSDLLYSMPGNKSLHDSDLFDVMRLYRAGGSLVDDLASSGRPIHLPQNPDFFHLDLAESVLRKTEGRAPIMWPAGMDRSSAMVESFAQKAEAYQTLKNGILKSADPESSMAQLRMRLNLPRLNSYERGLTQSFDAPTDGLLRGTAALGPDKLRAMTLDEVKQAVGEFKNLQSMVRVSGQDADLVGNSLNFMQDSKGNPLKPIMVYKRPLNPLDWTQDNLVEMQAARKAHVMGMLAADDAGPMTRGITTGLLQDADTQTAMSTHQLMDNQIQGSMVGAAPQTWLGSLGNSVRTTEFMGRDNPILLAANRIQDKVQRIARGMMQDTFQNTFGGAQNALKNPRNLSSQTLMDQFHSFRSGWDLNSKPSQGEDGFFRFVLGDTAENRERWFQQYQTEMPKGQTLIAPNGKEVVLDALGMDIQGRFNQVSETLRWEKNSLLRAKGLPEITSQNWYVPPQNTRGKYLGFLQGPDNKLIPGYSVVAKTPGEFEAMKQQMLQNAQKNGLGMGYVFRTQQDINEFANIWDKVQMDMMSPGVTALQPGKISRGKLVGQEILPGAFDESMRTMRDQYLRHATDIISTVFDDQIKANEARSAMATPLKANNAKFGNYEYKSIYDMYNESLLGRSKLGNNSFVGRLYNYTEGAIDEALRASTPAAAKTFGHMGNVWDSLNTWVNRANPFSTTDAATRDFRALSQALGPHMPYANAAEMIEKQGLGARPWTAAEMSKNLNWFGSASIIRMLEVVQPFIHLTATVNAMPAVLRGFAQRAGESVEDYALRVGHNATIFNLEKGNIGIPDMVKIGVNSFKRAWSPDSEADFAHMVQHGYIGHEVAAFHQQFGSISSKGDFERFINGDQSIVNPSSVTEHLKQKGLVGWLSVLTDKSYDFTRSWGHMAGLELADHLGIAGVENRNAFASDIANKMIANYSPNNRPEVFQGAVGTTLGLFQGFMQAYYQRMFRYVETKDYSSLIHQYAMQAGLFGVNSIPGFSQYNEMQGWLDKQGQDTDFMLRNHLGRNAADLFQHGVVANIPTLMGQDGMALYTRGNAEMRIPGIMSLPPGLQVAGRLAGGLKDAMNAFWNDNGTLTSEQMSEIVANAMPNRPIAGLLQQINHGDKVDAAGQLVTQTRGNLEMVYNMLGVKSMRQQDEINAYYANKAAQQHNAGAQSVLRLATRAAIRDGNTDAVPAIYQKYLENGGDPRNFPRWLKENQEAATTTRGQRALERDLKQVYKSPQKMGDISRLLDSGVSIDDSANDSAPNFSQEAGAELSQPSGYLGVYGGQTTSAN